MRKRPPILCPRYRRPRTRASTKPRTIRSAISRSRTATKSIKMSRRPDLNREPPDYKACGMPILMSADVHFEREMWPTGSPMNDELAPRCRQRCRQQNHPIIDGGLSNPGSGAVSTANQGTL